MTPPTQPIPNVIDMIVDAMKAEPQIVWIAEGVPSEDCLRDWRLAPYLEILPTCRDATDHLATQTPLPRTD